MLTKEEFQRTFIRMMDSVRHNQNAIGEKNCDYIYCENCPIYKLTDTPIGSESCFKSAYLAMDIIEIVEKWGKEHPLQTNKEKYKEVFGVGPCVGFDCPPIQCPGPGPNSNIGKGCGECRKKYWNAEYIPPKKED